MMNLFLLNKAQFEIHLRIKKLFGVKFKLTDRFEYLLYKYFEAINFSRFLKYVILAII